MEIPLFDADETMGFERIVFYPYPDLTRIWARLWLSLEQGKEPNVEVRIYDAGGFENASVYLMGQTEPKVETTIHLKDPQPGATYHVRAELTLGLGDDIEFIDAREFDMVLEFRDPEKPEPGFGMGVEWESITPTGRE